MYSMLFCCCYHLLVFVLHDLKPFHQVLGALQSGVQAVFLTFETGHILHGDAEQQRERARKRKEQRGWVKREGKDMH